MLLARLGQWTLAQRAWSKRRISATQRVVFTRVDELTEYGWPDRTRTCDGSGNSGVLCRLSYWPMMKVVHRAGFDPAASWASTRRSTS